MDYLQMVSVPAIGTIVYAVLALIKYTTNNNEKFKRFIPLTACTIGIILGVICFYFVPSIIAAPNVLVAIVMGGASGLSATGFNQIIKQLSKDGGLISTSTDDEKSESQDEQNK